MPVQDGHQLAQPGRRVRHGHPFHRRTRLVDDSACSDHDQSTPEYRVELAGPATSPDAPPASTSPPTSITLTSAPHLSRRTRPPAPVRDVAAGRSLKRSKRTTPSPVSTPRAA